MLLNSSLTFSYQDKRGGASKGGREGADSKVGGNSGLMPRNKHAKKGLVNCVWCCGEMK